MSSPGGPQQPYNDQFGQQGGFPPPGSQPGGFPPPAQHGGFPPPQQGGGFPPPQQGGFPPPQQGGFPPPQQGGGFPPPGPAPQPVRRGGGMRRRIITIVVALVVIGALAAVGAYLNRDAASKAKVGDCVQQSGSNDLKVVKCDDANADYKVVGRVDDKTQTEASLSACDPFPDAESAYWEGEQGKKGLVLCLAPAK